MIHRLVEENMGYQHRAQSPKYHIDIGPIIMVRLIPVGEALDWFGNFLGQNLGRTTGLRQIRAKRP
jgi:hypothetical protein